MEAIVWTQGDGVEGIVGAIACGNCLLLGVSCAIMKPTRPRSVFQDGSDVAIRTPTTSV